MPHAHFIDRQREADGSLCPQSKPVTGAGREAKKPPGPGSGTREPTLTLHGLGAEQRGFLMLLSDIVSGISCLFRGEIGFGRFGGLITIVLISPWERASAQT